MWAISDNKAKTSLSNDETYKWYEARLERLEENIMLLMNHLGVHVENSRRRVVKDGDGTDSESGGSLVGAVAAKAAERKA